MALVLVLALVQLALLWRRFYYGNDDLLQFEVADRAGLSWEMLSLNVFQHFGPYNRIGHLVVAQTGMSPHAGLAFVALNLIALLACCLWWTTELGLSARRRVLALVLIGLSVSVSESGIWFDAGMHILPAIAATAAVCAAHVRGVRSGLRRWHVVALVLFVGGQLTQERPIFALPLALLTDVLLLWRAVPWRERFRRLWAIRWPIGSLTIAAAGIAVALQKFVVLPDSPTPTWATTGRTMLMALSDYLLPSLANLPLDRPSSVASQLLVVAVAVAVGVLVARIRPGNAGPVLFIAAAFLLYYGFLRASPILLDTPASIAENAERLHYAIYVLVPVVVAALHLQLPVPRLVSGRTGRRLGAAGLVLLAVGLVVADNGYLVRQWTGAAQAHAWLDAVRADSPAWSDPDVTLVPLRAPPAMATSWAGSRAREDRLLDLVVQDFTIQDLQPRRVLIDSSGAVRPAALVPVPGRTRISGGACGRGVDRTPVRVDAHVADARVPAYLVIGFRSPVDSTLTVITDPTLKPGVGLSKIDLPAGKRTRLVPLDDEDVRDLVASGPDSLCIDRLQVVRPAVVESPNVCRYVDRFGRPAARVACP